nr:hypothetical protein [Sweet potato chlorotic stunt virus]
MPVISLFFCVFKSEKYKNISSPCGVSNNQNKRAHQTKQNSAAYNMIEPLGRDLSLYPLGGL